jgi:hypothetical protein
MYVFYYKQAHLELSDFKSNRVALPKKGCGNLRKDDVIRVKCDVNEDEGYKIERLC